MDLVELAADYRGGISKRFLPRRKPKTPMPQGRRTDTTQIEAAARRQADAKRTKSGHWQPGKGQNWLDSPDLLPPPKAHEVKRFGGVPDAVATKESFRQFTRNKADSMKPPPPKDWFA